LSRRLVAPKSDEDGSLTGAEAKADNPGLCDGIPLEFISANAAFLKSQKLGSDETALFELFEIRFLGQWALSEQPGVVWAHVNLPGNVIVPGFLL
jgi:hypothetical protein